VLSGSAVCEVCSAGCSKRFSLLSGRRERLRPRSAGCIPCCKQMWDDENRADIDRIARYYTGEQFADRHGARTSIQIKIDR
jgi:hypothetical protein